MNLALIRQRLDHERRTLAADGVEIQVLPHVTRTSGVGGTWHSLSFSSLSTGNADQVITEQVEYYQSIGAEFEWKVYSHDGPPDLRDRLARHGFEIGPVEAVLVLNLSDRPAWIDASLSCEVLRVSTLDQLELYRRAAEAIFEKDYEQTIHELSDAIRTGSTGQVGYMAMEQETAVSIGRLYTHPDSHFGGLYGGGTLPAHRGHGFYRATVAARARDAATLGAQYLLVDALPTSRPILERLGFIHLTDTWPCTKRG